MARLPAAQREWLAKNGASEQRLLDLESNIEKMGIDVDKANLLIKAMFPSYPGEEAAEAAPPNTGSKDATPPSGDSRNLTAQEVAEAVKAYVDTALEAVVTPLLDVIEAQQKSLEELMGNGDGIDIPEGTPNASLKALLSFNPVGQDDARVDGRTKMAKDGPRQTPARKSNDGGIPILNRVIDTGASAWDIYNENQADDEGGLY